MKLKGTSGGCSVVTASLLPLAIVLLAMAALVWPAWPAYALADACRIETTGASSPEWSDASASLAELALTEHDCIRVRIEITEQQARVLFMTADGRSAERIVATPAELRPTIDALRVQGPAPAPSPTAAPAATPATQPTAAAPRSSTQDELNDRPLRLALLAGVRGGDDSLLSPVLTGAVSVGWGVLELGATLGAEVQYANVQGAGTAERRASAAALGLHAGIRQPIAVLDLLAGARAALAAILSRDHDTQACTVHNELGAPVVSMPCSVPSEDERTNEWRVGAYVGFAVPRTSTLRFRTELSAEMVTPGALDGSAALTPTWALGALVGMEVAP